MRCFGKRLVFYCIM